MEGSEEAEQWESRGYMLHTGSLGDGYFWRLHNGVVVEGSVCDVALRSGKTPQEWREAIIIPIHKKGCRADCGNYRGICLAWWGRLMRGLSVID